MTLRDGRVFKGWTAKDYFESSDGIHWEQKAALQRDAAFEDGIFHVFIDPVAVPEEQFKAVSHGHSNRAQFDAFRAQRPDAWEPRAIFLLGEQDSVACLRGSVSPDGIRWTTRPAPLVVEHCDTLNTAYYDPVLRDYVLYRREKLSQ